MLICEHLRVVQYLPISFPSWSSQLLRAAPARVKQRRPVPSYFSRRDDLHVDESGLCVLWLAELKWHTRCKINQVYPKQRNLIHWFVMHWDKRLKDIDSVLQQNGHLNRTVSQEMRMRRRGTSRISYRRKFRIMPAFLCCLTAFSGLHSGLRLPLHLVQNMTCRNRIRKKFFSSDASPH
jgi:hypothetical protein